MAEAQIFHDNPRTCPLELGDLVQLNSGGPDLVVVEVGASGLVTVAWSDAIGFYTEALPRPCLSFQARLI